MKHIPMALLDFLLSTDVESTYIADLFTVTLTNGLVLYATDGQLPIHFGGKTFLPSRWGAWHVTGTTCDLGPMSASAEFEVFSDSEELLPNWNISLNEAAQLGLFDAATILIQTVYMPDVWDDTALGAVIRFGGQITTFTPIGRTTLKGEAKPFTFTLNQNMPRKLLQPSCGWTLGDSGCTVKLANFTFPNAVGAGTSNIVIVPSTAFAQADGYYTQGRITFTSGANNGLSGYIQSHLGGNLRLSRPFPFPVAVGDTFNATAGCDHTMLTCQQKFSNLIPGGLPNNFGGHPFIPNKETFI
ncbi:MAG: DUF2163 domain-containing protein [Acidobacteriaceae bacterium]